MNPAPRHAAIIKVLAALDKSGRRATHFEIARLLDVADVNLILDKIDTIGRVGGDLNDLEQVIVEAQLEYGATVRRRG